MIGEGNRFKNAVNVISLVKNFKDKLALPDLIEKAKKDTAKKQVFKLIKVSI